MNPPRRGNYRGRGQYFNYGRGSANRRPKPTAIQIGSTSRDNGADESGYSSSVADARGESTVVWDVEANSQQYPGWNLYFPEETFVEESNLVGKIRAFEEHIATNPTTYDLQQTRKRLWYSVELSKVISDETLMAKWSTFQHDLIEKPEETLNSIGLAMHQRLINLPINPNPTQSDITPKKNFNLQRVHVRIQTNIKDVKLNSVKFSQNGKLIVVRGNVVRVGSPEYRATWIAYRCIGCNTEQAIKQINQSESTPRSCRGCDNRRSSGFLSILSSPFTSTEASKTIYLQEFHATNQSSKVPRTIKIELFQDLVDSVYPGDDVTVHAIVQCPPQESNQKGDVATMRTMHLKAVSISSNRHASMTWKSTFSERDLGAIREIKLTPCPFRLLVHSLSPMIYGHEMVKAGLVLALLGGSDNAHRRSQSHILIVGDPGLGKSQMLQACADVSPKGIFVCGKTSSTAGLTVSIHHEKGNDTSLGAGALLLADQGTCCIDELDKMSKSNQALLEVMEQQCVSLAKAGVYCSLPARTSVIAAANPTYGHYNKAKTVSENIKMNPALLSRFDLVFIILDRPDSELDSVLHDYRRTLRNIPQALTSSNSSSSSFNPDRYASLNVRLKPQRNEKIEPLPRVLMQTYIAYARKHCHPTLSLDAKNLLKDFYLELRSTQQGNSSIPVTTRQLESMIRLTQARARAELCNEATADHALDVITIVRYSMIDVFSTDVGTIQLQRSVNGSGMSQASQVRQFIRMLQARTAQSNKSIFSMDELKEIAADGNLQFLSFADTIETMNVQGFLLKKGPSLYKFLNQ